MPRAIFKQEQECMRLKQILKIYEGDTFFPFCKRDAENFEHIFKCHDGLLCPFNTHDNTMKSFAEFTDARFLKELASIL